MELCMHGNRLISKIQKKMQLSNEGTNVHEREPKFELITGCIGSPDLVVEILSPSNNRKELKLKFDVYEENGVKEYWIVSPEAQTLQINVLVNNTYQSSRLYSHGDVVGSSILPGYELNVSDIFEDGITNNH